MLKWICDPSEKMSTLNGKNLLRYPFKVSATDNMKSQKLYSLKVMAENLPCIKSP